MHVQQLPSELSGFPEVAEEVRPSCRGGGGGNEKGAWETVGS